MSTAEQRMCAVSEEILYLGLCNHLRGNNLITTDSEMINTIKMNISNLTATTCEAIVIVIEIAYRDVGEYNFMPNMGKAWLEVRDLLKKKVGTP